MADDLDLFIRECWDQLGISQAEFSRRLGKLDTRVEQIRSGDRTFPLEEIGSWAEKLQLSKEKSEEFSRLCQLSHVNEFIREWILDLRRSLDTANSIRAKQSQQITEQDQRIAELSAKVVELLQTLKNLTADA